VSYSLDLFDLFELFDLFSCIFELVGRFLNFSLFACKTSPAHLYLYNNKFKGQIPSAMGNMKSLRELIIDQNEFTGTVPAELGHLQNLNTMFIFSNNLNGTVPEPICNLRDVSSLKYLWADCMNQFNCTCCSSCCDSNNGRHTCYYVNDGRNARGQN